MPPSTASAMPVVALADGEARYRIASATSSRRDEPTGRLPRLECGALRDGVRGLREQPADPRGVSGAGVHAVHADALAEMVGRHRERERHHRTLGRAVQRTLGQPRGRADRARVDDRRMRRRPQVLHRGATHAHDAEHVDVEDPLPLVDRVRLDRPLRTDARVVHDDVEAPHLRRGFLDRPNHRIVVGDVGLVLERTLGRTGRIDVEHADRRTARQRLGGDRVADARATTGDDHPNVLHTASK